MKSVFLRSLVVVLILAAGCVPSMTPVVVEKEKEGGTLNLWTPDCWPAPEATRFFGWPDEMIREPAYEALLALDKDLNIVPGIAKSWDVSADGKEFTFHLRSDVKFHDGASLTANDVKFSFELYYLPGKIPPQTQFDPAQKLLVGYQDFVDGKADEIAGIQVVDDHTVKLVLTDPNGALLTSMTPAFYVRMVPKHIWDGVPAAEVNQDPRWRTPIATGPFQIVKFVDEQYIEYERFDDYWGGNPNIERIFMKCSSADVALAQLERGELDYVVNVPPTELERLRTMSRVAIVSSPNSTWPWGFVVNSAKPLWRDVRARQALMYCCDRQGYTDTVLAGEGRPANHILQSSWAQSPDAPVYDWDPQKAKQLLTEAGFDFSKPLELILAPGVTYRDDYVPIFQANMREIGVEVRVNNVERARLVQSFYELDWDVFVSGTVPFFDPGATQGYWGTTGSSNIGWLLYSFYPTGYQDAGFESASEFVDWVFSIPEVDRLYDEGRKETDFDKRALIYQKIDKLLTEEVPMAFVSQANYVDAYNTRVQGVTMNPNSNRRFLGIDNWWLSE